MSTANNPAYPHSHYTQPDGDVRWGEDGFTQRERAAIDLRVPDSGQEWLDLMIRRSRRMDLLESVIPAVVRQCSADDRESGESVPTMLCRKANELVITLRPKTEFSE